MVRMRSEIRRKREGETLMFGSQFTLDWDRLATKECLFAIASGSTGGVGCRTQPDGFASHGIIMITFRLHESKDDEREEVR